MTRRTRSFIVDNSLGKVWYNTRGVAEATAANLVLGLKIQSRSLVQKTSQIVRVANNIGNTIAGLRLDGGNGGLLSSIQLRLATAPRTNPVIVRIRKGSTYQTSEVIGTISITTTSSAIQTLNVTYSSTDALYFDVTQTGSSAGPGYGLGIYVNYYPG